MEALIGTGAFLLHGSENAIGVCSWVLSEGKKTERQVRQKISVGKNREEIPMSDKRMENNRVNVTGKIHSGFRYSHQVLGERFYLADIAVSRESGYTDIMPFMFSDKLLDVSQDCTGVMVNVTGQFRSYNRHEETKNRLVLSVFVQEAEFLEEEPGNDRESNRIFLEGFICKEPVYRKTPLGRQIADILLAVNRPYGKSDYIPCIAWGRNARFAGRLEVGTAVRIQGRIQSREYMKWFSQEKAEVRVAYEVSVSVMEQKAGGDKP